MAILVGRTSTGRCIVMLKKIVTVAAFIITASIMGVASSHTAGAESNYYEHHPQQQVMICHAKESKDDPYSRMSVNTNDIDGIGGDRDHRNHTGPVAYSPAQVDHLMNQHISWGDIIPPTTLRPAGSNWTDEGKAVYNRGCDYPKVATATVEIMNATCDKGQKLIYGLTRNASLSGTPNNTYGPQDYTVIATASNDALFMTDHSAMRVLTLQGTLSGPKSGHQCDIPVRATPVEFIDPTCDSYGHYTIPQKTGVSYQINGSTVAAGTYDVPAGTTVTVTAIAQQGYKFKGEATTLWSHTFSTPEGCAQTPDKPNDIITTNISSSINCSTKIVTTITTTSTTTYSLVDNEWVANEPVVTTSSTDRNATVDELNTCPSDNTGTGLGSTAGPVAQLPYTSGSGTPANTLVLSAIAATATGMSLLARRILSRRL